MHVAIPFQDASVMTTLVKFAEGFFYFKWEFSLSKKVQQVVVMWLKLFLSVWNAHPWNR